MARSFDDLASEVEKDWDADARALYESANEYFAFQGEAQIQLGRELASVRESHSLTQRQLGELSGVDQAEISRIERGTANPTRDTLIRLGAAFKLRLAFVPQETVDSRGAQGRP